MRRAGMMAALAASLLGFAAQPASANSPAGTVREYVRALSERDGAGFCRTLAPFAQARVGAVMKEEPDGFTAAVREPKLCPVAADIFVRYVPEGYDERWAGARIVHIAQPQIRGKLAVVDLDVRNDYAPVTPAGRAHSASLRDRVYLVRLRAGWRLAKLSAVADAAGIGHLDGAPTRTPPHLAVDRRWYRLQLARDHVAAQRERATALAPFTDCSRVAPLEALADPLGDVSSGGPGDSAWPPWVDVRSVVVGRLNGTLCVNFELAAPMRTRTFFEVMFRRGQLSMTVSAARIRPGRAVVALYGSAVPGELGVDGTRVSLLVRRRDVPKGMRWVLSRRGGFSATAQWNKTHGLLDWEQPTYSDEIRP